MFCWKKNLLQDLWQKLKIYLLHRNVWVCLCTGSRKQVWTWDNSGRYDYNFILTFLTSEQSWMFIYKFQIWKSILLAKEPSLFCESHFFENTHFFYFPSKRQISFSATEWFLENHKLGKKFLKCNDATFPFSFFISDLFFSYSFISMLSMEHVYYCVEVFESLSNEKRLKFSSGVSKIIS